MPCPRRPPPGLHLPGQPTFKHSNSTVTNLTAAAAAAEPASNFRLKCTTSCLIVCHAPEVHLQVSNLLHNLPGLGQQLRGEGQRLVSMEAQLLHVLAKGRVAPPVQESAGINEGRGSSRQSAGIVEAQRPDRLAKRQGRVARLHNSIHSGSRQSADSGSSAWKRSACTYSRKAGLPHLQSETSHGSVGQGSMQHGSAAA